MKLLLKYDCQYGFKNLYMTETDLEYDIGANLLSADYMALTDGELAKEDAKDGYFFIDHLEDIYENYKTKPLEILDDYLEGTYECLAESILEDAYHTIFKKLVDEFPGHFKMYNCRLELIEDEDTTITLSDDTIITKADIHELANKVLAGDKLEVKKLATKEKEAKTVNPRDLDSRTACAILNISRQTLANWVKAGRIQKTANGKYAYESVMQVATGK